MEYVTYENYTKADDVWLDKYPKSWSARKLKFSVSLINEKVEAKDSTLEYMGLEHIESWTGKKLSGGQDESDGVGSVFQEGDVLFGKLRPYLAKVYRAESSGLVTTEALVLRPEEVTHPDFLKYFLLTPSFIDVVNGSTYGAKMPRASWDFIGELPVLLPKIDEQQKIAAFLDYKTQQIDQLIEKKKALIEKLEEKRIAVITQAVTKGLDKNVKLKPSGVDWLGDVPEHWLVSNMNYALDAIGDVDHYMPKSLDRGIPYVMTGDLKESASNIDFDSCKQVSYEDYLNLSKKIKTSRGDVIIARYATIGTVSYVDIDTEFLVSYSCVTIKPTSFKLVGLYLYYYFKSDAFLKGIQNQINTNTQGNVGVDDLKKLKVALPPISEQLKITESLENCVNEIDKLTNYAQVTIEKLQEYRSALITSAVTGKIDVRQVAIPKNVA